LPHAPLYLRLQQRGHFACHRLVKTCVFNPWRSASMFTKIATLFVRVRRDARILWHALRHPARPVWLLPAVSLIGLYLLSPIDLIPDVLPVIGVVDDLVLIPLVMAWLVRRLPDAVKPAPASGKRAIIKQD